MFCADIEGGLALYRFDRGIGMAKVLVVDDEDNMRFIIREMLEQDSHEVSEATSGAEAMVEFRRAPVALIITDLVMPDKNGLDLIMDIKQNFPDVNILAISGGGGVNGRFDYIPIAELIGASSVMRKPFKLTELREKVKSMLAS